MFACPSQTTSTSLAGLLAVHKSLCFLCQLQTGSITVGNYFKHCWLHVTALPRYESSSSAGTQNIFTGDDYDKNRWLRFRASICQVSTWPERTLDIFTHDDDSKHLEHLADRLPPLHASQGRPSPCQTHF